MNLKLTIFLIIVVCLAIVGFLVDQKNPQASNQSQTAPIASTALLVPSPTPLLIIDSSSNLLEETKKLDVADFSQDYKKLDQTLAQF